MIYPVSFEMVYKFPKTVKSHFSKFLPPKTEPFQLRPVKRSMGSKVIFCAAGGTPTITLTPKLQWQQAKAAVCIRNRGTPRVRQDFSLGHGSLNSISSSQGSASNSFFVTETTLKIVHCICSHHCISLVKYILAYFV